jgi:hypothetical protein
MGLQYENRRGKTYRREKSEDSHRRGRRGRRDKDRGKERAD